MANRYFLVSKSKHILLHYTENLGTGHAEELEYIFGFTRDWRYPATNNGLQPTDWEMDVTDFAENQWSNFSHFGEPSSEWKPIDSGNNSFNHMVIDNNADEMFKMSDLDWLMNFWLNSRTVKGAHIHEKDTPAF